MCQKTQAPVCVGATDRPMRLAAGPVLVSALLLVQSALAHDWPQFLGPARNGVYSDSDVAKAWPSAGPRVLWKRQVGEGYASPVVAGGRLIVFHRRGDREILDCLVATSGKLLWSRDYPTSYRDAYSTSYGPRATPTVAAGKVYTYGADGVLSALDLAEGDRLWQVETRKKFAADTGYFGFACSPLVDGSRLLVNVGGDGAGIVAFETSTGKVLWKATSDEASYSSPPLVANLGNERHGLFFTRSGLVDLDPADGRVRFRFRWRARIAASVNAATPLVAGDLVFISASYGTGAALLKIDRDKVKKVWSGDGILSNHYATSVHYRGLLFGFDGRQEYKPHLRCVEMKTGKVLWTENRYGGGSVTLVRDRLLVLGEDGEMVLARAASESFRPLARARILSATVRAYPALANGLLYVRNDDTLVCLDLCRKER